MCDKRGLTQDKVLETVKLFRKLDKEINPTFFYDGTVASTVCELGQMPRGVEKFAMAFKAGKTMSDMIEKVGMPRRVHFVAEANMGVLEKSMLEKMDGKNIKVEDIEGNIEILMMYTHDVFKSMDNDNKPVTSGSIYKIEYYKNGKFKNYKKVTMKDLVKSQTKHKLTNEDKKKLDEEPLHDLGRAMIDAFLLGWKVGMFGVETETEKTINKMADELTNVAGFQSKDGSIQPLDVRPDEEIFHNSIQAVKDGEATIN